VSIDLNPMSPSNTLSVAAAFFAAAENHAERPFLDVLPETAGVYGIAAGPISYAEAARRVRGLIAWYSEKGLAPGSRVGLLLENRPAFLFHWFALNALGVSVLPINSDLRSGELRYLIEHSDIRAAVVLPARIAELAEHAAAIGRELAVWSHAAIEAAAAADRPAPVTRGALTDECALLYTSGSTGRPKGCMLSNDYFLRTGRWYNEVGGMCQLRPDGERMLTPLPLAHINAMAFSTLSMMMCGGCLILLDRFHPGTWWDSVAASRAGVIHYLGVMPAMLLALPSRPSDRAHQVRFGFGAGVPGPQQATFEARFGFPLLEVWAMTETGAGGIALVTTEPRQVGTQNIGRPSAAVEALVVDDAGNAAGDEIDGELLVRAAGDDPRRGFFSGYLKDSAATEQAWAGGWFHTGDVVRRDASGCLHFVDRKKNIIRRAGENIAAAEVEACLNDHPAVAAVAVAALPDELRGEEVCALVVARPGAAADESALAADMQRFCLNRLAYFKAPGYVAFVDALPLTATQKPQRAALRELARAALTTPRCFDLRAAKKRST
jgi:acyl-CoA synthetase (AMP-forming)/AMP-acid ligase II